MKLGIAGLGWWGGTLVDSVQQSADLKFVAAYTRSRSEQDQAIAKTHHLRLADSCEAMLADPEVEGVVLATPPTAHCVQIEAAAAAGKHVFCEKPFVMSKAEAERAIAAVKKAGVTLGLGYNRRFHPSWIDLKQRINAGELGTILHVECTMSGPNGLTLPKTAWRSSAEQAPLGGLFPMGVHAVDGLIDLFGDIDSVFCQSFRRAVPSDNDDTTTILFRMKSGMSGYLGTMMATAGTFRFQVYGSKAMALLGGSVHVAGQSSEHRRAGLFGSYFIQPIKGDAIQLEVPMFDVNRAELEAFATAAGGGAPYPVTHAQMINGVAATDAIIASSKSNQLERVAWSNLLIIESIMDLGKYGHLTYSTLVHPGDTWPEMWDSLTTYVPRVKARVSPNKSFGVSLRLSNASASVLVNSPAERAKLKSFLADNDMYLYTVNAFPFGPFKNQIVKEQVYEPDWRGEERTRYTMNVAEILADVGAVSVDPSIQSPPLGFKPRVTGPEVIESYAANLRRMTVHLHQLRERTGRTVTLAVEPEPYCFLETTAETVDFFTKVLRSERSLNALGKDLGMNAADAAVVMRRHIGTVYDICHQAVEFENISHSLQSLVDNDVPVFKLQEAAAVQVPKVTPAAVEELRRWADSVYLTQTIEMKNGKLSRFLNLEDAIASYEKDPSGEREWRIHFHVPVFLETLGEHFKTTRFAIAEALAFHKAKPLSAQLEIETYTWDVLPQHLKTGDIVDYVTLELEWVQSQLK